MEYRFKSPEIETAVKAFCKVYKVEQEELDDAVSKALTFDFHCFYLVGNDDEETVLSFPVNCVEQVAEYNPKAWNNFPEATPPEGVFMRVETIKGFRYCAKFDGKDWISPVFNGGTTHNFSVYGVVHFRPWDDEE